MKMLSSRVSLYRILRNTKSNHNAQVCFKSTVANNLPRWNEKGQGSSSSSGIDTSFSSSSSVHLETCLERFQPVIEKHSKAAASSNNVTTSLAPLSSSTLQELVDRAPLAVKERSDKAIPPGADHDPLMQLFRYVEKRSSPSKFVQKQEGASSLRPCSSSSDSSSPYSSWCQSFLINSLLLSFFPLTPHYLLSCSCMAAVFYYCYCYYVLDNTS